MQAIRVINSPDSVTSFDKSVFLAGGISNCPDWQRDFIELLKSSAITALNPRRAEYRLNDREAAKAQIEWEHHHLKYAEAISFWFPKETLCPITLYELGFWSGQHKPLFVGVHPEYQRKIDVEIQTMLARPEVRIVYSLKDLAAQVMKWETNLPQASTL